jgi:hypothetical protein
MDIDKKIYAKSIKTGIKIIFMLPSIFQKTLKSKTKIMVHKTWMTQIKQLFLKFFLKIVKNVFNTGGSVPFVHCFIMPNIATVAGNTVMTGNEKTIHNRFNKQ